MEQNAYQGIQGLPSPSSKNHTPYINLIVMAAEWAENHRGASPVISEPFADFIIYISFLVSETEWWIHAFTESQRKAALFYRDLNTYWIVIAIGVLSPEVERVVLLCLPKIDRGKYFPLANPSPESQEITPEATPTPSQRTRQTRELNPQLKNLPTYALVKHYALVRKTSVFSFIVEQSDNLTFAKIHNFIQHKNNYQLSSKGKVVYDGGFSWIARELGTSLSTVGRAFAWMAPRKLVTKIAPQDHRIRKNSRWYVCTSMAQNLKLWSLARSH